MSSMRPVRVFSLKVPPGGAIIEANPGVPAAIRITMAAIDPSEEIGDAPPRATLKIIHDVMDFEEASEDEDSEDDEDFDEADVEAIERRLGIFKGEDGMDLDDSEEDDEDESESDSDDEMVNGGPSDPEKRRIARDNAILKKIEEAADDAEDSDEDDLLNGINGKLDKGKGRALPIDGDSDAGMEEYVVCTLDRNVALQQPLDLTIRQNEECYFRVAGGQTVYLSGNFVVAEDELASEYDSHDDEDDLDEEDLLALNGLADSDEESLEDESEEDGLDDIDDPRITEIDTDEDEAPQLVQATKSKKKRAAEDDSSELLEGILKKALNDEEKRSAKKLKTNAGQAVAGTDTNGTSKPAVEETKANESKKVKKDKEAKKEAKKELKKEAKKEAKAEAKAEESTPQANGKKVQFAEKLEQGPTPSKNAPAKGPHNVGGVTVDDKKAGTGPAAKKGDRVGLRYIGKLKDGKVFDSNKKGKPFTFKIGSGEVIKGWDIGVAGMSVGGERRITIPAKLGYGSKAMPQIPGNSELIFDLKMISIN